MESLNRTKYEDDDNYLFKTSVKNQRGVMSIDTLLIHRKVTMKVPVKRPIILALAMK